MVQNRIDHDALGNEGDDPHLRAAGGTGQGIDLEDLPYELGPAAERVTSLIEIEINVSMTVKESERVSRGRPSSKAPFEKAAEI